MPCHYQPGQASIGKIPPFDRLRAGFGAWGDLVYHEKDGTGVLIPFGGSAELLLDRGYTGHEHLQSVGLIHMNGRLYDPMTRRFLAPDNYVQDPFNTQNFNRYGYVYNSPLMFSDPSGEWFWTGFIVGAVIGAAAGGAAYIAHAIQTGDWNFGQFGISVLGGALIGGISGGLATSVSALTVSAVVNGAASAFAAGFFPALSIPVGDWSFSISPAIAFGNASGAGVSVGISYSDGNWSFSGGVGVMSYGNYNGFGKNSLEVRKSILAAWDDGKRGISLGTNFWSGDFKQQTGMLGLRHGDWNVMYENDGSIGFLGDGGDSYRTAALNLSYGDYSVGFNLFTGYRDLEYENENLVGGYKGFDCPTCQDSFGRNLPRGSVYETGEKYRLGALTIGYKGYRAGVNSEKVRHAIQNHAVHNLKFGFIDKRQRMFENQSWNWNSYGQYKTSNIFTSW